jgi:iron complex transport system ATP-binding protein
VSDPVLAFRGVGLRRGERWTLRDVDWSVAAGERWVVLGPNGSGKTTLVRLAAGFLHASEGTIDVLGKRIGRTDVRTLRTRIAFASASLSPQLRPTITALEAVVTARHAALEPWWHTYTDDDWERGRSLLARFGIGAMAAREFGTLSEGERQRTLLARSLMPEPELILLDEPTAAVDLAGREALVTLLDDLAADPDIPPIVFVTHHVEEIPPGFTHALLLRDGRISACGPLETTLTADALTACFDLPLELDRRRDGRWWAWGTGSLNRTSPG